MLDTGIDPGRYFALVNYAENAALAIFGHQDRERMPVQEIMGKVGASGSAQDTRQPLLAPTLSPTAPPMMVPPTMPPRYNR